MTQNKFIELMELFGCDIQEAKNIYNVIETGQNAAFSCVFSDGLVIIAELSSCNSKIKCSFSLHGSDGIKCNVGDFESIAKESEEIIRKNKHCISFVSGIKRRGEQ